MTYSKKQEIPKSVANQTEGSIPNEVAVSPKLKDFHNEKILFSFKEYNSNQCELVKMQKVETRKLTATLSKMSDTLYKHIFSKEMSGLVCKTVHNSGNYSVLFSDLQDDVDIYEIYKAKDSTTNRIFGFFLDNVFYIKVIWKKHR